MPISCLHQQWLPSVKWTVDLVHHLATSKTPRNTAVHSTSNGPLTFSTNFLVAASAGSSFVYSRLSVKSSYSSHSTLRTMLGSGEHHVRRTDQDRACGQCRPRAGVQGGPTLHLSLASRVTLTSVSAPHVRMLCFLLSLGRGHTIGGAMLGRHWGV